MIAVKKISDVIPTHAKTQKRKSRFFILLKIENKLTRPAFTLMEFSFFRGATSVYLSFHPLFMALNQYLCALKSIY